jgi:hypothetical protein
MPIATAVPVRLDEEPAEHTVHVDGGGLRFTIPPRALRSLLISFA